MLKFSSRYLSLTFIIIEIIIIKSMIYFYKKFKINSIVAILSLLLIIISSPFSPSCFSSLFELSDFIIV